MRNLVSLAPQRRPFFGSGHQGGADALACVPGVKAQSKVVAHISAGLTLLILLALFMPLRGAFARADAMAP